MLAKVDLVPIDLKSIGYEDGADTIFALDRAEDLKVFFADMAEYGRYLFSVSVTPDNEALAFRCYEIVPKQASKEPVQSND